MIVRVKEITIIITIIAITIIVEEEIVIIKLIIEIIPSL